jgi:uncharacterized membrane protein YedE/YeeE
MASLVGVDAQGAPGVSSIRRPLDWRLAAVLLGAIGIIAVALQGPIGVSTAFVTTEAAAVSAVAGPQVAASNAYWKKIGTALSPEWVFVVGMIIGGFIAATVSGTRRREDVPAIWRERFGGRAAIRFGAAFAGGFLLLFGARLAGGCTSGHIISGTSQLAISGMVFAVAVFAAGVPFARALYGRSQS